MADLRRTAEQFLDPTHAAAPVPASISSITDDLARLVIGLAAERGVEVADIPLPAIAEAAGLSNSTLVRRLGGSRRTLDEAVRAAGVDPGGRPVRDRVVDAAARLIDEQGLAAVTVERVAAMAGCSTPALHAAFRGRGRDGVLWGVFERYAPLADLEELMADRPVRSVDTVRAVHQTFVAAFAREPRVFAALLADVLARPTGPGQRFWTTQALPRLLNSVAAWLDGEVKGGRFKPLPVPSLVQLLFGPLATHLLLAPALGPQFDDKPRTVAEVIDSFTSAFINAVATDVGNDRSAARHATRE